MKHRVQAGAFQFTRAQHEEEMMKNRKIERIVYNGENVEDRSDDRTRRCLTSLSETEPGEEIEFNQ